MLCSIHFFLNIGAAVNLNNLPVSLSEQIRDTYGTYAKACQAPFSSGVRKPVVR